MNNTLGDAVQLELTDQHDLSCCERRPEAKSITEQHQQGQIDLNSSNLVNFLRILRASLKQEGDRVLHLKQEVSHGQYSTLQHATGEVIANVTLAYRHIEDAAMRLGNAIQAINVNVQSETSAALFKLQAEKTFLKALRESETTHVSPPGEWQARPATPKPFPV